MWRLSGNFVTREQRALSSEILSETPKEGLWLARSGSCDQPYTDLGLGGVEAEMGSMISSPHQNYVVHGSLSRR